MADKPSSDAPSLADVQARLREVARSLRDSENIDPDSRLTLAELVDELNTALASAQVPPVEVAHLAESTAHLAESLQQQRDRGLIGTARDRFAQALVAAEAHAPGPARLARQVLDALANLGI